MGKTGIGLLGLLTQRNALLAIDVIGIRQRRNLNNMELVGKERIRELKEKLFDFIESQAVDGEFKMDIFLLEKKVFYAGIHLSEQEAFELGILFAQLIAMLIKEDIATMRIERRKD